MRIPSVFGISIHLLSLQYAYGEFRNVSGFTPCGLQRVQQDIHDELLDVCLAAPTYTPSGPQPSVLNNGTLEMIKGWREGKDVSTALTSGEAVNYTALAMGLIPYFVPLALTILVFIWILITCVCACCCKSKAFLCFKWLCGPVRLGKLSPSRQLIFGVCLIIFAVLTFCFVWVAVDAGGKLYSGMSNWYCGTYVMVDRMTGGTWPVIDESPFIGLHPIATQVQAAADDLNPLLPVVVGINNLLNDTSNYKTKQEEMVLQTGLLIGQMNDTADVATSHFHTCTFCELYKVKGQEAFDWLTTPDGVSLALYATRLVVELQYANGASKPISDSVLAAVEPVYQFSNLTTTLFDKLYIKTQLGMHGLEVLAVVLVCLICLTIATAGVVEIIWQKKRGFFGRRKISCGIWVSKFTCGLLLLFLGSLFFVVVVLFGDICSLLMDTLSTKEGWANFGKTMEFGQVSDIGAACLASDGSGDILTTLGIMDKLDYANTLNDTLTNVTTAIENNTYSIESLNSMTADALSYAVAVVTNVTLSATNADTYTTVIRSGIQDSSMTVPVGVFGFTTLYGLTEVEALISPLWFEALHGDSAIAAAAASSTCDGVIGGDGMGCQITSLTSPTDTVINALKVSATSPTQWANAAFWARHKAVTIFIYICNEISSDTSI
eukprot:GHVR01106761.1.p1 GENE.GHVR01106761.1~~GHVR01106761.1.p1  ORF type:complete len:663 (+),score=119.87 GHVR01106761.1:140-2128(+)